MDKETESRWKDLATSLSEDEFPAKEVPETSRASTSRLVDQPINQSVAENVPEYKKHVQTIRRVERPLYDTEYYPMYRKVRGYCLILNIYRFPEEKDFRHGSEDEAVRLKELFEQLYFNVIVTHNPNTKTIHKLLDEYSKRDELIGHDCFILFVLSHGHNHVFYGADKEKVEFENVVNKFNNHNCKNLIDKPKLFFFNCCRGPQYDYGTAVGQDDEWVADAGKSKRLVKPFVDKVAEVGDIMICYATLHDHSSYRNRVDGTWLATDLFKAITDYGYKYHLLELLTDVSRRINDRTNGRDRRRQVVEVVTRGFKKQLYFNPGYSSDSLPLARPNLLNRSTSL